MKFIEYYRERRFSKKPLETYGKYKVFLVSGKDVRNSSPTAQEFGGSGDHSFYDFIPENEIWIEDDVGPSERNTMIASELYVRRLIDAGMNKDKAYKEEIKKEKDYRESIRLSKKNPLATNRPARKGIHLNQYGVVDGLQVWIVNGQQVRDIYKVDFIEGGNPAVYGWCPNNEIWVEKVKKSEIPLIVLHEFVEYVLMKYKRLNYEKAHRLASKVEFAHRGGRFSKKDALSLTKDKVLAMVDKYRRG